MTLFRTPVVPNLADFKKIDFGDKILSIGSCFAQTVGEKIEDCKIDILNNPAGIIFNPWSIHKILNYSLTNYRFEEKDLEFANERWFNII